LGLHADQRHVLVFVEGQDFRRHLLVGGQPTGELARLDLAGFGENQPIGVHNGAQRDGFAVHVELDDRIACRLRHGSKGPQGFLAAAETISRQLHGNRRNLRGRELRQQQEGQRQGGAQKS